MDRRGFTFVEMMTVIVLLGVVTAIAVPRFRGAMEKQNVRSVRAGLTTLVATARGVAVQRGCPATLNLTADSVWVTACRVNAPGASEAVGGRKLVPSVYGVSLSPSAAAVTYDPRGMATRFQRTVVRITGPLSSDSLVINEVGKVVRR